MNKLEKAWFWFCMIPFIIGIFYLITFDIWYALSHNAAECILARDTITCVRVIEGK